MQDKVMRRMDELKVGDMLWEAQPSSTMLVPGVIRSIHVEKGMGLFNPQTFSGTVLVNNISVVSFTNILPKSKLLYQAVTAPLAFVSWLCPSNTFANWLNSAALRSLGK